MNLGLLWSYQQAQELHTEKHQEANRDMHVCKVMSSLRRCDQVTQPKAPLNSAAIYPITRSPDNHHETGKRKKPSKAIPLPCASRLILMMMPHASFKPECITWSICSVKTHNLLPHTPLWDRIIKNIFTCPLSPNGRQASSIWSSWDAQLELAQLNLDDDHHLMSSSHGLYEISLLMHAHGKIPNPHRQHKGTYDGLVHKA